MEVIVKTFLQKSDSSVEVRRIPLSVKSLEVSQCDGLLETLMMQIASRFPSLTSEAFDLSWQDSEGDSVMMSSDAELCEALTSLKGHVLKLYATVRGEAFKDKASTMTGQATPELVQCGQAVEDKPGLVSERFKGHVKSGKRCNSDRRAKMVELRSQVPVGQRRWARGYIRRWREENVESATTTSGSDASDCEKDSKARRQRANVPAVYALWLDTILPRMHQRWAGQDPGKFEDGFDEIKAQVPMEFRRWCRCYLKRRFGPKDASGTLTESDNDDRKCPRKSQCVKSMIPLTASAKLEDQTSYRNSFPMTSMTKSEMTNDKKCHKGRWATMDKKELRNLQKTLKSQVPIGHRRWAKGHIRRWRVENVESSTTTSGSDASDGEKDSEVRRQRGNVPDVYALWLDSILPRMHQRWAGQDPGKFENGFDEIKAQVPMEFRRWCRCYLKRRFGPKDASGTLTESDNDDRKCPRKSQCVKSMIPLTASAKLEDQTSHRNSFPMTSMTKSEMTNDKKCHKGRWATMDKKGLRNLQKTLKSQVPIGHRRWAKGHIRRWRVENIESSTTTSGSDASDGEKDSKVRRQRGNVPAVYALWLDTILPRMHQRWAGQDPGKFEDGFDEIKAEVPMEFRRWCRCYLRRRSWPKNASDNENRNQPRKNRWAKEMKEVPESQMGRGISKPDKSDMSDDTHHLKCCWATMDKKELKAVQKKLKGSVPLEYHIWTKEFIRKWRQDHVTCGDEHLQSISSGSESEAAETEATSTEVNIPADYEKWLRKLLNRIHSKMAISLVVPDDEMVKGCMGQLKTTVPLEYRQWVRCYVHRRFSTPVDSSSDDNNGDKQHSTQSRLHPRPRHARGLYLQQVLASQKQWLPWLLAFLEKWSEFQALSAGAGQGQSSESRSASQSNDLMSHQRDTGTATSSEDTDKDQDQDQGQSQEQTLTELKIPPRVIRWMMKAAAKEQSRGNRQEREKTNMGERNGNTVKTRNYTFKYV